MKTIYTAFCNICEFDTPQVEVICIDVMNDESWTEPRCKYCFDDTLEPEDRYQSVSGWCQNKNNNERKTNGITKRNLRGDGHPGV